jgi:hypothetical protein
MTMKPHLPLVTLAIAIAFLPQIGNASCFSEQRGGDVISVGSGYGTGNDLVRSSDVQLNGVVVGFLNGLILSTLIGAREACTDTIIKCTTGRKPEQLVAMLRKYLRDNPHKRHERAHWVMWSALVDACFSASIPSR